MDKAFDDRGHGSADDGRDSQDEVSRVGERGSLGASDTGDVGDLDASWWHSMATSDDDLREAAVEFALRNDLRHLSALSDTFAIGTTERLGVDSELAGVLYAVGDMEQFSELFDQYQRGDLALDPYGNASTCAALVGDVACCRNALLSLYESTQQAESVEIYLLGAVTVLAEEGYSTELAALLERFIAPYRIHDYEAMLLAIAAAFSHPADAAFLPMRVQELNLRQSVQDAVVYSAVEEAARRGQDEIDSLVEHLDVEQQVRARLRFARCLIRDNGYSEVGHLIDDDSDYSRLMGFELGYGMALGGHYLPVGFELNPLAKLSEIALYQGAVLGRQRVLNELRRERGAREQ